MARWSVYRMIDSRLKLGSTSIVSGPSCSGKTTFVNELIKNRNSIFNPLPNHVILFYGKIEPKDKIPHVKYLKGLHSDDIIIGGENNNSFRRFISRVGK